MEAHQAMTTNYNQRVLYHWDHTHQEEAYWAVLARVDITLFGVQQLSCFGVWRT
jgi:hypothetical protein